MSYVLFWDIDGTLLTTGRAGIFAWEEAVWDVLGQTCDFSLLNTAGRTDTEIASELCAKYSANMVPNTVRDLLKAYEEKLPSSLPRKTGSVLKNVVEILSFIQGRRDIYSVLLTGNTRAGALAKLNYYGLTPFFSLGAFSDGCLDRVSIARKALNMLEFMLQPIEHENIFVIGDTPHDIECGNAIHAKTVAVATGGYDKEELNKYSPWLILKTLPKPGGFIELLGLA